MNEKKKKNPRHYQNLSQYLIYIGPAVSHHLLGTKKRCHKRGVRNLIFHKGTYDYIEEARSRNVERSNKESNNISRHQYSLPTRERKRRCVRRVHEAIVVKHVFRRLLHNALLTQLPHGSMCKDSCNLGSIFMYTQRVICIMKRCSSEAFLLCRGEKLHFYFHLKKALLLERERTVAHLEAVREFYPMFCIRQVNI